MNKIKEIEILTVQGLTTLYDYDDEASILKVGICLDILKKINEIKFSIVSNVFDENLDKMECDDIIYLFNELKETLN